MNPTNTVPSTSTNPVKSQRRWLLTASLSTLAVALVLIVAGLTSSDLPGSIKPIQFAPAAHPVSAQLLSARCATHPSKNHLTVAALCINAPVVITRDVKGLVVVPADVRKVGWYDASEPLNASIGSTVIVGHINYAGQGAGAFASLTKVHAGERIGVSIAHQGTAYWRVISLKMYPKLHLPASLFTTSGTRYLNLITCGGTLRHLSSGWHYSENIVVRAVPWHVTPTTPASTIPTVTIPG